mmetsp:Transcript_9856/g.15159  ORF Transcript_9856/g.15159 Transcript_9856/m.15159 type:complete len:262 (-) Transcript_9856:82-867(-)|eukprot:CAMPEP_0195292994 /NCGR_PEP_ID=MMETSP0707-20130614/11380_1 /TAXON_ID=33640 /ORGANISM="Asterionellopsis glacialis, Strain CCMP134" /LENGTH=261 /DNA_ID=CAMNT_0040353599 /DNA_START=109 /DNA_END=894 /DNA_ORIENTATION=+
MESIDSPNSNDEKCYISLVNSQCALGDQITQLQNRLDNVFQPQFPCPSQTDSANASIATESNILIGNSCHSLKDVGINLVRNKGSIPPPPETEGPDNDSKPSHQRTRTPSEKSEGSKRDSVGGSDLEDDSLHPRRTKRRRSTLMFLDYIFQTNDHQKEQDYSNRLSEDSSTRGGGVNGNAVDFEPLNWRADGRTPEEFRQNLWSLRNATKCSQKSQKQIHSWDRKMGLRANHSTTMRKSSRSRRKIMAMVNKELHFLQNMK